MLTTELCARLSEQFPLQLPEELSCFACTQAVLDQREDTEDGTILIGEGAVTHAHRFYLLCNDGVPQQANVVYYPDAALTLPLLREVNRLLEPEQRLHRQLHRLEKACLAGGLKDLLQAAYAELSNPVLVVDDSFRTLAMEPEFEIGIDSWDRILRGEAPQRHDLNQAEKAIENFTVRNVHDIQVIPYTEPDGRSVRRMVGAVVAPDNGKICGGVEVIELYRPFTQEDCAVAQRLAELLQHYLAYIPQGERHASPEERLLQELLFCEPGQREQMYRRVQRFPALMEPARFYLASIPLSHAHQVTSTNQRALLAREYPEGWILKTEDTMQLLLPGSGEQPEADLQQRLQTTGLRMEQTVILSMPFPSLLQLGTVWRFNQEAAATARELHCAAGCRSASELYEDVLIRTITRSANLHPFIHPMLRRLLDYDRTHDTTMLHTLSVYLNRESNLHETAAALYIHRNTLVYRLQRIRELLQLDLDDPDIRSVLRASCSLLEFYQSEL